MNRIKKAVFLTVLMILAVSVCTACGAKPETAEKQVDLQNAMQSIRGQVDLPEMMDLTDENLLDYFGLESQWFTEAAACINANGYEKEEILLLHAADADSAAMIREQLDLSLQNAAEEMRNYLPEQYAMIQSSKVESQGLYVWLFISDANEQIQTIWHSILNT